MQSVPKLGDQRGRFRVQAGHLVVTVQGHSTAEAVRQARKKLCEEMPRLWDVIQTRPDSDFQVTKIN